MEGTARNGKMEIKVNERIALRVVGQSRKNSARSGKSHDTKFTSAAAFCHLCSFIVTQSACFFDNLAVLVYLYQWDKLPLKPPNQSRRRLLGVLFLMTNPLQRQLQRGPQNVPSTTTKQSIQSLLNAL